MSSASSVSRLTFRAAAWVCTGVLLVGLWGCTAPVAGGELRASAPHGSVRRWSKPPRPRGEVGAIRSSLVEVDHFQGLLVRAGVPPSVLPKDGRRVRPEEAERLLSWVAQAEVPLADFGPWRMAAHLLWGVLEGGQPVRREELHARMRRFAGLLVLRPDGCLVRATTGTAVQKVGQVEFVKGALRAEGFEVGPFYTVRGGMLYAVEGDLEIHPDTVLAGVYAPQEGTLGPAWEGAGQAAVDSVEGVLSVVLRPIETLEGLAQLPGVVRALIVNAPQYWEHFRAQPHGEQVRMVSRLLTTVLITCGTGTVGATRAAAWGSRLGRLGVPILELSSQGMLAVRQVAVPVGRWATAVSTGAGTVFVLHMAQTGAGGGGGDSGRPWPPPSQGPGGWVRKNEGMKPAARRYQCQVTGAPEGWVYRVERNGEKVDFDGFRDGVLVDAKGPNYDNKFDADLAPKHWFNDTGAREMVKDANRQLRVANGIPIEWHVAEAKAAEAIERLLRNNRIRAIRIIHTPPLH